MQYLTGVTTLKLDETRCTGCGACTEVCPRMVFTVNDGRSHIENRDSCMECGACARNCVPGALSVRAGVGCAQAVINSLIRGGEPDCDCSGSSEKDSCCC